MIFTHRTNRTRRAAVGFAIAAAALTAPLALTGCTSTAPSAEAGGAPSQAEFSVTIEDTWAKATSPDDPLDNAMSGVFGTLKNQSKTDLTITGLTSEVAGLVELHEVVGGQMRKIEGDVTIPAGGSLLLEPGADHIMLMDLNTALVPGDEVPITLTFSDDSTLEFIALAKDTAGANESYTDIDHGDMDHGDMDHGNMDHGDAPADDGHADGNDAH